MTDLQAILFMDSVLAFYKFKKENDPESYEEIQIQHEAMEIVTRLAEKQVKTQLFKKTLKEVGKSNE